MCVRLIPRGCCGTWFFDSLVLNANNPNDSTGKFIRTCLMLPVGGTPSNSYVPTDVYHIDPSDPLGTQSGYTADGITAWIFARVTGLGDDLLFVFDIPSRTQLCGPVSGIAIGFGPYPFSGNDIVSGYDERSGVNPALKPGDPGLLVFSSRNIGTGERMLSVVDETGGFTTYHNMQFYDNRTVVGSDEMGDYLLGVAPLNWPVGIVVTLNHFSGHATSEGENIASGTLEFSIADVSVVEQPGFPGSYKTSFSKTVFKTITYDYPSLSTPSPRRLGAMAFDDFDGHYGAEIIYDYTLSGSTYTIKNELIIDGNVVLSQVLPGTQNYFYTTVHACHPHETLGGGYVAVVHRTGGLPNTTKELHVYHNGIFLWKTTSGGVFAIYGSTDRWIIFDASINSAAQLSALTNGVFTKPASDPTYPVLFLAKHDGTEIIPIGRMTDTYGQISRTGSNPTQWSVSNSFLRDSSVGDTLPATYAEMYERRSGTGV